MTLGVLYIELPTLNIARDFFSPRGACMLEIPSSPVNISWITFSSHLTIGGDSWRLEADLGRLEPPTVHRASTVCLGCLMKPIVLLYILDALWAKVTRIFFCASLNKIGAIVDLSATNP